VWVSLGNAMKAKQSKSVVVIKTTKLGTRVCVGFTKCDESKAACLLLYGDYVWVSLGNAMKAKQSKSESNDAA
jgi:hypothetical protein